MSLVFGTNGASSVFDDGDSMFLRDRVDLVECGWQANLVDHEHSFRLRRNGTFHRPGIDVVSKRIDVDENWRRSGVDDTVGGSNERQARTQDFVASLDASGDQRQMQCRGAR